MKRSNRANPLTYQQRASLAVEIIGDGARSSEIERAVSYTALAVSRLKNAKQSGRYGIRTQAQKKAAVGFGRALHVLQIALKNCKGVRLGKSLLVDFPLDEVDLEIWRGRAESAAKTKLDNPKTRKLDFAKAYAAETAARLLEKHGLPLGFGRKGKFCQLAAVMYGDSNADFLHHCRAVTSDRIRVPESV